MGSEATAPVDLRAYVAALEAALTRARGREIALVGHEFVLAQAWHAAGVPLELVLQTLSEHATKVRAPSLEYLRRHVEARVRRSRSPLAPNAPAPHPEEVPGAGVAPAAVGVARDWLARLRAWLAGQEAVRGPDARSGALRERVETLAAWLQAAPEAHAIDAALEALDDDVSGMALHVCGAATLERFRAEAARSVARQRGRLDERALEEALARYVRRRARAACDVPERG